MDRNLRTWLVPFLLLLTPTARAAPHLPLALIPAFPPATRPAQPQPKQNPATHTPAPRQGAMIPELLAPAELPVTTPQPPTPPPIPTPVTPVTPLPNNNAATATPAGTPSLPEPQTPEPTQPIPTQAASPRPKPAPIPAKIETFEQTIDTNSAQKSPARHPPNPPRAHPHRRPPAPRRVPPQPHPNSPLLSRPSPRQLPLKSPPTPPSKYPFFAFPAAPNPTPIEAPPATVPIRFSWLNPDHPSAIYHAKSPAHLTIAIDNLSKDPLPIAGQISFGPANASPTSLTPLSPTTIPPGQRATIPIDVNFASAGTYELHFRAENAPPIPIASPSGLALQCIFAPRTPPTEQDSPWLTPLPKIAAITPGYLADYIKQTTVRRFLIDERFAFDPQTSVGLGFGASLDANSSQINDLLAETKRTKAALILRIALPSGTAADPKTLAGFRQYLSDALSRAHGTLRAIALTTDPRTPITPDQAEAYRTFYLAAYELARKEDKSIQLLGASSAAATNLFLLQQNLGPYIDALAITDAAGQLLWAQSLTDKHPIWVLPPQTPDGYLAVPPAAALGEGAAIVTLPPPHIDRGVTAHLLGGSVFMQRLHVAGAKSELPFIAVFQGDGFAVAAIAGLSAGTAIDDLFPALSRTRTTVDPLKPDDRPPYPNLEISDDTHSMRVVDASGAPVDCRVGDTVYVPASDKIMYLLQAGTADDLAGSLRPARLNRMPLFAITAQPAANPSQLTLRLTNLRGQDLGGTLRLILPPDSPPNSPSETLAEKDLPPLPPAQSLDLPLDLVHAVPANRPLIAEVITPSAVQRTALIIPKP